MPAIIKGVRGPYGISVTIDCEPLPHIERHSPDGFEWAYAGSGPADLARSMLIAAGVPVKQADTLYQEFKWQIVAALPYGGFEIGLDQIQDWVLEQLTAERTN